MATHNLPFAESIIRYSPDAIIAFTLEGTVLFWNEGAEAIFGYTSELKQRWGHWR